MLNPVLQQGEPPLHSFSPQATQTTIMSVRFSLCSPTDLCAYAPMCGAYTHRCVYAPMG
jgi:hypothetical protein